MPIRFLAALLLPLVACGPGPSAGPAIAVPDLIVQHTTETTEVDVTDADTEPEGTEGTEEAVWPSACGAIGAPTADCTLLDVMGRTDAVINLDLDEDGDGEHDATHHGTWPEVRAWAEASLLPEPSGPDAAYWAQLESTLPTGDWTYVGITGNADYGAFTKVDAVHVVDNTLTVEAVLIYETAEIGSPDGWWAEITFIAVPGTFDSVVINVGERGCEGFAYGPEYLLEHYARC
jgi:hypothetical protein